MRLKCLPSQFAAFLILAQPRTKNEEKTLQKRKKAAYFYTTLHDSAKIYFSSPEGLRLEPHHRSFEGICRNMTTFSYIILHEKVRGFFGYIC